MAENDVPPPLSIQTDSREIAADLTRAANALQNMQAAGDLAPVVTIIPPMSPNIPPAMFGAGGPMCVVILLVIQYVYIISMQAQTIR